MPTQNATLYSTTSQNVFQTVPLSLRESKGEQPRSVKIYDSVVFETIDGFGGAFTDASAYNYARLSSERKADVLKKLFSRESGLGWNFCRLAIGSCDFSREPYSYVQDGDLTLKSFSIEQDLQYIIPFVKDALQENPDLMLFASPWSPPAFMKTNGSLFQGGSLLESCADSYADYFVRFCKAYEKEGISIFAVTVQNEPEAIQTWESCHYSAEDEAKFIVQHLAPALSKSGLDVKILIWDHNKDQVFERVQNTLAVPGARDLVYGIGFHWYTGDHFEQLSYTHQAFPEKSLICTEFCTGAKDVLDGDFNVALRYAKELTGNLIHGAQACVEWNMILDTNGGPYHNRSGGCKAPVIVDPETDSIHLLPSYYAMAHFSKFIQRGAKRIGCSSYLHSVMTCAFCNPDGSIVAQLINPTEQTVPVSVVWGKTAADTTLEPRSISTITLL